MQAKNAKFQMNGRLSLTVGETLQKLEQLSTPEAQAAARLIAEHERAAVQAGVGFDTAAVVSRLSIENARAASNALTGFARACLDISRIERIDAIDAYRRLDQGNVYSFAEHIESVFGTTGLLGKVLANRLGELRLASLKARQDRDSKVSSRARAERAFASALFRLSGSLDAARSVLQLAGIPVATTRNRLAKKADGADPESVSTAVRPLGELLPAIDDGAVATG